MSYTARHSLSHLVRPMRQRVQLHPTYVFAQPALEAVHKNANKTVQLEIMLRQLFVWLFLFISPDVCNFLRRFMKMDAALNWIRRTSAKSYKKLTLHLSLETLTYE